MCLKSKYLHANVDVEVEDGAPGMPSPEGGILPAPGPAPGPSPDRGTNEGGTTLETVETTRSLFPETWLWTDNYIGYAWVFLQ